MPREPIDAKMLEQTEVSLQKIFSYFTHVVCISNSQTIILLSCIFIKSGGMCLILIYSKDAECYFKISESYFLINLRFVSNETVKNTWIVNVGAVICILNRDDLT